MISDDMFRTARGQSAEDIGCDADDFIKDENVIVPFRLGANARKYLKEPIAANLVSYGNNVVAAVADDVRDIVEDYIGRFEFYHLFETPNMNWLNERLVRRGYKICFMAEYFLPGSGELIVLDCPNTTKLLYPEDLAELYLPQWGNALCRERRELDVLCVGAYDGDKLIGLAGCSADCESMRQIGIDVLPEYRMRGVASALTSRLAAEIMKRGKIPFYCSAWSNIRSVRNAIGSGFVPAWVELTVKPASVVDGMNGGE